MAHPTMEQKRLFILIAIVAVVVVVLGMVAMKNSPTGTERTARVRQHSGVPQNEVAQMSSLSSSSSDTAGTVAHSGQQNEMMAAPMGGGAAPMRAKQKMQSNSRGVGDSGSPTNPMGTRYGDMNTQAKDNSVPTGDQLQRMMMYTGYMRIQAPDVEATRDALMAAVKANGGFVMSSTEQKSATPHKTPSKDRWRTMRYEVRVQNLHEFVRSVQKLGKGEVTDLNVHGQDMTSEYVDNDSRLRDLIRSRTQMLKLADQAKTIPDILNVQSHLQGLSQQIETLQGRQNWIRTHAVFSTLTIDIQRGSKEPKPATPVTLLDEIWRMYDDAIDAFVSIIRHSFLSVLWFIFNIVPLLTVATGIGVALLCGFRMFLHHTGWTADGVVAPHAH